MKRLLIVVLLVTAFGCMRDTFEPQPITEYVPVKLEIADKVGIKLEEIFVQDKVSMNVKLETSGNYRVKIKDISGKLISQEILNAKSGDNILSVYTTSLPKSSYKIELHDMNNSLMGFAVFVVN